MTTGALLARDLSYMLKERGIPAIAGFVQQPTHTGEPEIVPKFVETPFSFYLPIVSEVRHSAVAAVTMDVANYVLSCHNLELEMSKVPFFYEIFKRVPDVSPMPDQISLPSMTAQIGRHYTLKTGSAGEVVRIELANPEVTNFLFSGASGSGKTMSLQDLLVTVMLNTSPEDLTLDLIDFKISGLRPFANLPHSRSYTFEVDPAIVTITRFRDEMMQRVESGQTHPVRYLVIEEIAELTELRERREIRDSLLPSIGRLGREVNMRLIVTAQKPTVDVIGSQLRQQLGIRITGRLESGKEAAWALNRPDTNAHMLPGRGAMIMVHGGDPHIKLQTYYTPPNVLEEKIQQIKDRWSHINVEREPEPELTFDELRLTAAAPTKLEQDYAKVRDHIDEYLDPDSETHVKRGSYAPIAELLGIRYSGPVNRNRVKDVIRYAAEVKNGNQEEESNST